MNSDRRIIVALFSLAFGLRVLYAAVAGIQPTIDSHTLPGSVLYAREISSGLSWLDEAYSPKAPGYPLLLAAVFLLTRGSLWAGILLQAVLGALTVVLIYLMGRRLSGPLAGALAAVWLALNYHHIHYASLLARDVFACFLLVWLVYIVSRPFIKMRYAIYSAVVYTALVHVDPQYLLLFPFIALFLILWATHHLLLNIQYLFLFAGLFVLLSVPWTVRNYAVYHQFVPVSLETGRYIQPLMSSQAARAKVAGVRSYPGKYRRNAIEYWRVTRLGGRASGNISSVSAPSPSASAGPAGPPPEPGWSLRHNLINILVFGLPLPFFVLGIFYAFRDKKRTGQLITIVVAGCFLIRLFFGGNERARLPVEPLIIVLAIYGLFRLLAGLKRPEEIPAEATSRPPAR